MKIVLTEQQLKKVIQEAYGISNEQERYLDHILEKISKSGYDSLSDEEKDDLDRISNGEDVNKPLPEKKIEKPQQREVPVADDAGDMPDDDGYVMDPNGHLQDLFFDIYPHGYRFRADNENWIVFIKWAEGELKITNGDIEFYIVPFANNYGYINIRTLEGKTFKTMLRNTPQSQSEMERFVEWFNANYLPKAVDSVMNNKKN